MHPKLKSSFSQAPWWKKLIAGIALMVALSWVITNSLGYKYGYDQQNVNCLNFTFALVKKEPDHQFQRGEYIAFNPHKLAPGVFKVSVFGENLGKLVAGVPGDKLEVVPEGVFINGKLISTDFSVKQRKPLFQTVTIPQGYYFGIGTAKGSFDSRYFGLIPQSDVYGVIHPIL